METGIPRVDMFVLEGIQQIGYEEIATAGPSNSNFLVDFCVGPPAQVGGETLLNQMLQIDSLREYWEPRELARR